MDKRFFIAVFFGALIVTATSAISWIALPFHMASLAKFTSEETVAVAIRENATEPGMYVLPNAQTASEATSEEKATAQKEAWEKMKSGPILFASIRPNGAQPEMAVQMAFGFLLDFLVAFCVLWIVSKIPSLNFWGAVGIATLLPNLGLLLGHFANWNWWFFSLDYTLAFVADGIAGWFLASVAMIRIRD